MPPQEMAPPTAVATPCPDPARKLRHLDCAQSAPTNTNDPSPELADGQTTDDSPFGSATSPINMPSTPSLSRREYCNNESGSPTRVSSPLRHSVSYTEPPELPFPFPTQTDTTDPTKSPTESGSRMALTGDKRSRSARPAWLSSTPSSETSSEATPTRLRTPNQISGAESTNIAKTASPTPTSASAGRFSFFSTALKGLTSSPATSPRPTDDSDDLINLNIDQTLHSMTSPTDRSTFSPAAFKNLQMVATGMLHKFQDAYTQRTIEVRELRAEQAAQADEQSETETKMQHLRMQLEGMAQKAAEQEEMMQSLMAALTQEKKLRMEQSENRSGGSIVSEDLGAEEDQKMKWRKSGGTSRSDTSYDTDEEGTEEASVFSARSRSPTIATVMSDLSPLDAPNVSPSTSLPPSKASSLEAPSKMSRQPQGQMTAFQKLFKGLSVENPKDGETMGPSSCRNCQGQDVSVAWDTVSLLKDENKGLKERVGDLEGAMESALDVVNGVGL